MQINSPQILISEFLFFVELILDILHCPYKAINTLNWNEKEVMVALNLSSVKVARTLIIVCKVFN